MSDRSSGKAWARAALAALVSLSVGMAPIAPTTVLACEASAHEGADADGWQGQDDLRGTTDNDADAGEGTGVEEDLDTGVVTRDVDDGADVDPEGDGAEGCEEPPAAKSAPRRAASAPSVRQEGFDDMPAYDVAVRDPSSLSILTAELAVGGVENGTVRRIADDPLLGCPAIVWEGVVPANGSTASLGGRATVSLTWRGAGVSREGKNLDVRLTLSDMQVTNSLEGAPARSDTVTLVANNQNQSGKPGLHSWSHAGSGSAASATARVEFLDAATGEPVPDDWTYALYVGDLDYPELRAQGNSVANAAYYTREDGSPYPWAEQVSVRDAELLSDVYVAQDTLLNRSSSDGWTTLWGSAEDLDTERSAFSCLVPASGFEFRWAGSFCGTPLFSGYRSHTVSVSAGIHGTASPSGSQAVFRNQPWSCSATPDRGYHTAALAVNGAGQPTASSWGASRVRSDIEVAFSFAPDEYAVTYDLEGGTATGSNPTTYTVETPSFTLSNPTREGYAFAGWVGTDLDGPATTVTIEQGSLGDRAYTATWEPSRVVVTIPTMIAYDGMPAGRVAIAEEYQVSVSGDFTGDVTVSSSPEALVNPAGDTLSAATASSSAPLVFSGPGTATDRLSITGEATSASVWEGAVAYTVAWGRP